MAKKNYLRPHREVHTCQDKRHRREASAIGIERIQNEPDHAEEPHRQPPVKHEGHDNRQGDVDHDAARQRRELLRSRVNRKHHFHTAIPRIGWQQVGQWA